MSGASRASCPHCHSPLARLELNEAVCDHPYDLVCFNDDCSYYVRGWTWMEQQYGVKASYRYRVDGGSGFETPVPVWSSTALRSSILPDDATSGAGPKEHP
jgi:hypothetical protein